MFLRGDVTELPTAQELVLNDRHYGVTPKVGGRITRAYSALLAPLQALGYLTKLRLAWTADTTDDTLAVAWNTKSLKTLCDDMQTLGAIESDHPMRVSATANNGNIASVATRKLQQLDSAATLDAMKAPPGNRLEALAGDRRGQHSIRINDQWRICFVWKEDGVHNVEIVDYH